MTNHDKRAPAAPKTTGQKMGQIVRVLEQCSDAERDQLVGAIAVLYPRAGAK